MTTQQLKEYYTNQIVALKEERKQLRLVMNENKKRYKEITKEITECEEALVGLKKI